MNKTKTPQKIRQTSMPRYVSMQAELANVLGVSRWTIQRARKLDGCPGARTDGRLDIEAWRTFLAKAHDAGDDEAALQRTRNLKLKNDKLEAQIAIMRRDWAPMIDVEKWGAELGAAIRIIVSTIHLSAPTLAGISIPEIETRLKQIEDDILDQLHTIHEQDARWRNEPAKPMS